MQHPLDVDQIRKMVALFPKEMSGLYRRFSRAHNRTVWQASAYHAGMISISETKVVIPTQQQLDNPDVITLLLALAAAMPEFSENKVIVEGHPSGDTLQSLVDQAEHVHLVAPRYTYGIGGAAPGPSLTFDFWRLRDSAPSQMRWFHATLASRIPSILQRGLLTRKVAQQTGWASDFNIYLTEAVYLTNDIDFAAQIAQTVASRGGETSGAVVEVSGRALENEALLVADEDAFVHRAYIGEGVGWGHVRDVVLPEDLPDYYVSMLGLGTLGVFGNVSPEDITFAFTVTQTRDATVIDGPLASEVTPVAFDE